MSLWSDEILPSVPASFLLPVPVYSSTLCSWILLASQIAAQWRLKTFTERCANMYFPLLFVYTDYEPGRIYGPDDAFQAVKAILIADVKQVCFSRFK